MVVARAEPRQAVGQNTPARASGLAFAARGDLPIAANALAEVLSARAADLAPARPGLAQTHAIGASIVRITHRRGRVTRVLTDLPSNPFVRHGR